MKIDRTFFKKQWGNILMVIAIILLLVPQTGTPIKAGFQRLFAGSPDALSQSEQMQLTAFNWPLTKLNGEQVNFEAAKGKVVVVNLWATWCPPCIAEMPSMQELYNTYGDKVEFYFVSSEESERLTAFMEKKAYELPVYIQKYAAPEPLQSRSLPTTFVIDKEGRVVLKETGAKRWDSEEFYSFLDDLLMR